MSKNSKNYRNLVAARSTSKVRKNGGHGPASTVKTHNKKKTWYNPLSPTYFMKRNRQGKPAEA